MKKLNKLQINPERLIKNEELISLKGGMNCACKYFKPSANEAVAAR